jgi:hypothetical protein
MKFSAAVSLFVIANAACSLVSAEKNAGTASHLRRTEEQPEDAAAVPIVMHSDVPLFATPRIVGGDRVANVETYPWFVQGFGCAGTLIAADMVLTAAHCFGGAWRNSVLLNTTTAYDFGRADLPVGSIEIRTLSQTPHPDYNSEVSEENDFMLVKLVDQVPDFQLVTLNFDPDLPLPDRGLRVIGVGTTSSGGQAADFLRQVDVDYISNSDCIRQYAPYNAKVNGTVMICAGVAGGGKDSCQGDSGGPLFDENTDNAEPLKQVGVVSWGFGCASRNFAGVNSRISGAEDWIKEVVCGDSAAKSERKPDFCFTPTAAPVASPAATPTAGAVPTPAPQLTEVEVIVRHDIYPAETGWTLKDSSGKVLRFQNTGSITSREQIVSSTVSVPDGAYTFEIFDTYGDGISQQNNYQIKINGQETYVNGSAFRNSATGSFVVGEGFLVAMKYDYYASETGWRLDATNGGLIFGKDAGSVTEPRAYRVYNIDTMVVRGEDYVFTLGDTANDGFCCRYGRGYIGVYSIIDSNTSNIQQVSALFGDFTGDTTTFSFSIPENDESATRNGGDTVIRNKRLRHSTLPVKTLPSTAVPLCTDVPDATFDVEEIGAQTCAWLSSNIVEFVYLCESGDVAVACPGTCNICGSLGAP